MIPLRRDRDFTLLLSGRAALAGSLLADRAARRFPLGRIAVTMLWVEALMFPLYAAAVGPQATTLALGGWLVLLALFATTNRHLRTAAP